MGAWKPPTRHVRLIPCFIPVSIHGGVEAPNSVIVTRSIPNISFNTWGRGSPQPGNAAPDRVQRVSIHGGVEAPNHAVRSSGAVFDVSIHGGVEAPNGRNGARPSDYASFNTWGRGSPQPGSQRQTSLSATSFNTWGRGSPQRTAFGRPEIRTGFNTWGRGSPQQTCLIRASCRTCFNTWGRGSPQLYLSVA